MERLLTAKDIAVALGVTVETARDRMSKMPCVVDGRIKRVRESAFTQYIASHEQTATTDNVRRRTERTAVKRNTLGGLLNPDGTLCRRR